MHRYGRGYNKIDTRTSGNQTQNRRRTIWARKWSVSNREERAREMGHKRNRRLSDDTPGAENNNTTLSNKMDNSSK